MRERERGIHVHCTVCSVRNPQRTRPRATHGAEHPWILFQWAQNTKHQDKAQQSLSADQHNAKTITGRIGKITNNEQRNAGSRQATTYHLLLSHYREKARTKTSTKRRRTLLYHHNGKTTVYCLVPKCFSFKESIVDRMH
jgi:hypothetical protein